MYCLFSASTCAFTDTLYSQFISSRGGGDVSEDYISKLTVCLCPSARKG